ncbi:MAG: alpha-D-ribose 1-methylphosphonate 5-phosphate C-P-lyase PhnJ, partial [Candidatus Eremiobacteraeota bacterium]|nr:alpha-D-ribose 1-methylphosphonate 5-phosphate C-P-lyase PhnJ [Candidatus Eremiobacteraeota bacterium]
MSAFAELVHESAASGYAWAYLDEDSKREVRRALLKAVCIPGYQVAFAS